MATIGANRSCIAVQINRSSPLSMLRKADKLKAKNFVPSSGDRYVHEAFHGGPGGKDGLGSGGGVGVSWWRNAMFFFFII